MPSPACTLIVDDRPDALRFTVKALKEAGHVVAQAISGSTALKLLATRESADLVVSTMPYRG
jgi:CheY-like chemotaxis protein